MRSRCRSLAKCALLSAFCLGLAPVWSGPCRACGTLPPSRAQLLRAASAWACSCSFCTSEPAEAMAMLVKPANEKVAEFDKPRDKAFDAAFANGMNSGMKDYEEAVSAKKEFYFERLLKSMPAEATLIEVGMGSFPNARYFGGQDGFFGFRSKKDPARGLDIIGVDPNDSMERYARDNAAAAGILQPERKNSLRVVHGVAEALPLETNSADAVVCTLTLCSVLSPEAALAEVKRVLKPGGKFLFHEHVLSETDEDLADYQRRNDPMQVLRADGCHLIRRTLDTIKSAGFTSVDGEYYDLKDFTILNPTVTGIATA